MPSSQRRRIRRKLARQLHLDIETVHEPTSKPPKFEPVDRINLINIMDQENKIIASFQGQDEVQLLGQALNFMEKEKQKEKEILFKTYPYVNETGQMEDYTIATVE